MELSTAGGGKMSWALAEKLKAAFPDVELFPRAGTEPAGTRDQGPGTGSGEQGTAAPESTPVASRRPAHEVPPQYLTPGVYVPREKLLPVCTTLAGDPEFGLTYLSFVSAVDWPDRNELEVLYHLYSHQTRQELALKVRIPRDDAHIPSVRGVGDGGNWPGAEASALLGIPFDGPPTLPRIMMPDDWVGHPPRKDYVSQDPPWLVEVAKERQKDAEGLGLGERV